MTASLFWSQKHHTAEEVDAMIVENQAARFEKDLVMKEMETLDVLKQLEMSKRMVDDLNSQLQREASKIPEKNLDSMKMHPSLQIEEHPPINLENPFGPIGPSIGAKQSPRLILMALKQAKVNLSKTTTDLAGIRASVELLRSKIEKEKVLLDETHAKLTSNTALVSSLEEELNQTILKLHQTKSLACKSQEKFSDITKEIQRLSSEIDRFTKMKESSKSEVMKLTAEFEQTRASIKTAEIRWLAAKKMAEESKESEAVAIAEIKALTDKNSNSTEITLSVEEYAELTHKAQEAEESSRKRIEASMAEVEDASRSKLKLLMEAEKAEAEAKTSRKALEEALLRVEAAEREKLAVEETLRSWRSEQGQRRRAVQNSPRFKNSTVSSHRRDSRMLDLNGLSLVTDVMPRSSGTRPTLSIGQILRQKLTGPEEYDVETREKINAKPRVSLGQMLSISLQMADEHRFARKQGSAKRRKFVLVGLSLLRARRSKKARKAKL